MGGEAKTWNIQDGKDFKSVREEGFLRKEVRSTLKKKY